MPDAKSTTGVKKIMVFFGMTAGNFMKEWKLLSDQDKADLKQGIEDGTLTY